MSVTSVTQTIVQEITVNAPAAKIFEALTDPERRKAWWGAEGRFQTTHVESDLRVGGRWKMSGTGFGRPFMIEGTYREIKPPRLLIFTWLPSWQAGASETLVRFELAEAHGVTTVRVIHSGLSPEGVEAHKGWAQILDWLRAYAER